MIEGYAVVTQLGGYSAITITPFVTIIYIAYRGSCIIISVRLSQPFGMIIKRCPGHPCLLEEELKGMFTP